MMIPFAKLHGAENDFLLTWAEHVPEVDPPLIARRICARNTGIGADGWMIVKRHGAALQIALYNSDGSSAEISGNGTRCAAAFGLLKGAISGDEVEIITGAGVKRLRVIRQQGRAFVFEMNMGTPQYKANEISTPIELAGRSFDATILDVGNPQCAIFVDVLPKDWRTPAAEAEKHERFPRRTNVSFFVVRDRHRIDAVFYERGAGETRSSGTGSTGAGAAAILRGAVESPVEIHTPAGMMTLRWDESMYLTGPAELIGEGDYFLGL
jgi:diaminopimelate epimerase